MKKFSVRIIMFSLVMILQPFLLPGMTPDKKPRLAPLNPEFVKYLDDVKTGKYRSLTADGRPMGEIPSPVDLSHVKGVIDKNVVKSYPTTYDLRTQNKLTSVKNQGSCGACWAFATFASLESCLMPSENRDFSEQSLNSTHGFNYAECAGGNRYMSSAYLARWDGPIEETDLSYPYSLPGTNAYTIQKHVQEIIFLPERANYQDNNTVKYFVTNYGAVMFSYYDTAASYNSQYRSYYYLGTESPNHAVAIVGWDDNFPAAHFNTAPSGDGAFLVKNSWGSFFGDGGYYYMSYYDSSLRNLACFTGAESSSNYQRKYELDPYGWSANAGWEEGTSWGANFFTAVDNLPITAVGFYVNDSNVGYEIGVYKGVTAGQPMSGTRVAFKTGSIAYPGYHTIKLSTPVSLTAGEKFSVVIKYANSTYAYPIPMERRIDGYSSNATANAGESYISIDATSWVDITSLFPNSNVCIKVFAGTGSSGGTAQISLSRDKLNFGCLVGGITTSSQQFRISNAGTGTMNWTLSKSDSTDWLSYDPGSGVGPGTVTVSGNGSGLAAGTYTGSISVSSPEASNSPQTITVTLSVMNSGQSQVPFGEFATPTEGSTVMSSVPVTGWVLDDVEVSSVKIYNGEAYIGDAVFIEGARPDVQQAFPGHPFNYRSGWGYMMLTHFLPGGGNGVYTIYAKATDVEGHEVTLGSKTITCDNAHAVKPFGAIDTPTQGGTASGKSFLNWGWVLTPNPNMIPTNGSTISVYVDGVNIGHPHYNNYRSDIATFFPGYANTDGAVGYFYLDTTKYTDGVHTISWLASDNAGNTDGIGSRFFAVLNASNDAAPGASVLSSEPVRDYDVDFHQVSPYENDIISLEIKELERVEIHFDEGSISNLSPLPIGSTLDREKGVFYWQPGAGFIGDYEFVFLVKDSSGAKTLKKAQIKIVPKY